MSTKIGPLIQEKVEPNQNKMQQLKLPLQISRVNSIKRDKVESYNEALEIQLGEQNIHDFYQELSSDSDSDMEGKLTKLKGLFKDQKIDKFVTVTSPRGSLGKLGLESCESMSQ